jgi:hypothetical protein
MWVSGMAAAISVGREEYRTKLWLAEAFMRTFHAVASGGDELTMVEADASGMNV